MIDNQFKNTHIVLSELSESVKKSDGIIDSYFDHIKDGEILNPVLAGGEINSIGNNEALPSNFFSRLGLRTLIVDTIHGRLSLSENNFIDIIDKDTGAFKWRESNGDLIFEDLEMLFKNSRVVEFADWSEVKNASDIWDNLRQDVIKPLRRNDFDFIFYTGDASSKLIFEVDEFLDILSDYSLHGKVTVVSEERNATHLWEKIFNGNSYSEISTLPGLAEKGRSIFGLNNIDHLILDSIPATLLFSKNHQLEIVVRKSSGRPKGGGRHFDAGYMLGLLLKIEISHSVALGLAVSGVYTENGNKPDGKMLVDYIEKWMGELESFKPEESQLSIV